MSTFHDALRKAENSNPAKAAPKTKKDIPLVFVVILAIVLFLTIFNISKVNHLKKVAAEIKKVAIDIEKEAAGNVKDLPVYLTGEEPKDESPEISNYRNFLQRLEKKRTQPENTSAIRYLNFLPILFEKINKTTIQRNTLIREIQKHIDKQKEKEQTSEKAVPANMSSTQIITLFRKFLNKYDRTIDVHPILKLFKEILNYGVVYGLSQFLKLFTMPNKFWSRFNTTTEKREIKKEEKGK